MGAVCVGVPSVEEDSQSLPSHVPVISEESHDDSRNKHATPELTCAVAPAQVEADIVTQSAMSDADLEKKGEVQTCTHPVAPNTVNQVLPDAACVEKGVTDGATGGKEGSVAEEVAAEEPAKQSSKQSSSESSNGKNETYGIFKRDFNGHYVLTATDDFGPFLVEQGAPWVTRMAAKAGGHGVGKVVNIVKQVGDVFSLEVKGPKNYTQTWTVDGVERTTDGPDGPASALISALWTDDNKALELTMKKKNGTPIGGQKWYFEGNQRICIVSSPKGLKFKRTFSRK